MKVALKYPLTAEGGLIPIWAMAIWMLLFFTRFLRQSGQNVTNSEKMHISILVNLADENPYDGW